MRRGLLLRRNLRFHWRGNLAVLLGVAVGTAVLTGALLVGDSLRGSLRELTERQLGWVDYILLSPRFFRAQLAGELASTRVLPSKAATVNPVIVLQASVTTAAGSAAPARPLRRASRVAVWGVDSRFWANAKAIEATRGAPGGLISWLPWVARREERRQLEIELRHEQHEAVPVEHLEFPQTVIVNQALAEELGVGVGDPVILHLQRPSTVPRETLLGRRDAHAEEVQLSVSEVLQADNPVNEFSVSPAPTAPRAAFVYLPLLQEKLGQEEHANGLLVSGPLGSLPEALRSSLTLDDWGLTLQDPKSRTGALFAKLDKNQDGKLSRTEWRDRVAAVLAAQADKDGVLTHEAVLDYYQKRGYLSLESRQMLLEPAVADAALKVAKELGWHAAPTLVYLANTIKEGDREIPYSVVAALDPSLPAPLGPFLPPDVKPLKDDEIILAGWKDSPLPGKVGDPITLTYFQPEHGNLQERTATFRLVGVLPMAGVADDPDLTPEFPGITDKLTLSEWNPPFPYDNKRVTKRDEEYWKQHRTTPKAYITLAAGQRLWSSRFGQLTSIRLAPPPNANLSQAAAEFRKRLLAELRPEQGGFVFDPVRERGLEASSGGMNFGMLFIGFSFFLIAAALLLVGLLFRLNLDRRASEIGLLMATGFRRGRVRRLLLTEGAIVAALGGLLGLAAAVGYAWAMLELLRSWWPGALDRSLLRLHVTASSLLIGYFAGFGVSLLTIAWAVRILGKVAPSALLAGEATRPDPTEARRPLRWAPRVALGSLLGGLVLIPCGSFIRDHEARAGTFFTGGFLLLTAGLAAVWTLLRRERPGSPSEHVANLGVRNAGRHPMRSLLTAGLLAAAAFLIVAVESFRREPDRNFLDKDSGSGGFALMGESDLPVFQDLNSGPGHDEMAEALERHKIAPAALNGITLFPFRLRSGDDASCLNLYQPRKPRLLGVPDSFIKRGGFHFAALAGKAANPWTLLEEPSADGSIPVFGEKNTLDWMLGKSLGDTFPVPDEHGRTVNLRIAGVLQDSVFQSELLMSEANFLKLYPTQEGYNFFMIEAPPDRIDEVKGVLDTALADRGFEATPTATRMAAYFAVENTYLSTFQALGGLGLLLGALGLAVVLLRGVWERRGELALLRALGFRRQTLGWLVLVENAFLLLAGLGVGTVAALLSVAPHLIDGGAAVPWLRLAGMLGLVLLVGLAAGALAMRATLRAPLLPALRRE